MYLELGPIHTGIFNMADVSVTIAAILFITGSLIYKDKNLPKASL